MTRGIVRIVVVACVALTGLIRAQPPPPAPADLASVLTVMRDPAATPAQKERLVGKVYVGVVSVQSVRLSADRSIVSIYALPFEPVSTSPAAAVVRLIFDGRADDEKVQELRPSQQVRVRGRLKDISVAQSGMPTATFTGLVIEGPAR